MIQKGKKIKTEEKKQILEDNWSWKRFFMILVMLLSGITAAVVSSLIKGNEPGSVLALFFSSSLFLVIFILGMEIYRLQKGWFHEKANNYVRRSEERL